MPRRKDTGYQADQLAKDVDARTLRQQADEIFDNDSNWKLEYDKAGIQLYSRKDLFGNIPTIKYRSAFNGDWPKIEQCMFSEMLEHMPEWSAEFISGEVLEAHPDEALPYKILKTRFKTPFFMKNREYVFYFSKHSEGDALYVFYFSVADEAYNAEDAGFIRARLYPTIYRFTKTPTGQTRIDHTLSTDLGRDMGLWFQNSRMVIGGMVKANVRDCKNLVQLMGQSA